MLTGIKGYYEKREIIWEEDSPVQSRTDLIITFLSENVEKIADKGFQEALEVKYPFPTILTNH